MNEDIFDQMKALGLVESTELEKEEPQEEKQNKQKKSKKQKPMDITLDPSLDSDNYKKVGTIIRIKAPIKIQIRIRRTPVKLYILMTITRIIPRLRKPLYQLITLSPLRERCWRRPSMP